MLILVNASEILQHLNSEIHRMLRNATIRIVKKTATWEFGAVQKRVNFVDIQK